MTAGKTKQQEHSASTKGYSMTFIAFQDNQQPYAPMMQKAVMTELC